MKSSVAASIFRRLEYFIHRPPTSCSVTKGADVDAKFISPLRNALRLAIAGNENSVSSVVGLFSFTSPSAVLWRIRTVIVYTFNRLSLWWVSHSDVKFSKGILPRVAYGDTSPAVMMVYGVGSLSAPAYHTRPNSISRGPGQSVGSRSAAKTPTRSASRFSKSAAGPRNDFSAVADTNPNVAVFRVRSYWRYGNEFAEYFKPKVIGMVAKGYDVVRHFGTSSIECLGGRGRLPSSADYTVSVKAMCGIGVS